MTKRAGFLIRLSMKSSREIYDSIIANGQYFCDILV